MPLTTASRASSLALSCLATPSVSPRCSRTPALRAPFICLNISLHDCSKAGTIVSSMIALTAETTAFSMAFLSTDDGAPPSSETESAFPPAPTTCSFTCIILSTSSWVIFAGEAARSICVGVRSGDTLGFGSSCAAATWGSSFLNLKPLLAAALRADDPPKLNWPADAF